MYKVCIFILSSKQSTKAAQNSQYLGVKKTLPTHQIQVVKVLLKYAQI